MAEARARLGAVGAQTSVLEAAQFKIVDLHGAQLALAVENLILIDRDAAGFGWFVDATPGDDDEFLQVTRSEFWARRGTAAQGRMDLLTAVMHEMGHLLGWDHAADGSHLLMEDTLPAGVRRVPMAPQLSGGSEAFLAAFAVSAEEASAQNRTAIDSIFADLDSVDDPYATVAWP